MEVEYALYCLNKYAREYAKEASECYEQGFKEQAKVYSVKKSALYDLKTYILEELFERNNIDSVEIHTIDNKDYYCFYIGEYSYHTPIDEFEKDINIDEEEKEDISKEFDPQINPDNLDHSERKVLTFFDKEFQSANNFVYPKIINNRFSCRSLGWRYLSDYVEQGDKIPEEEILSSDIANFMLEPLDLFETVENGTVQIIDRYGIWEESTRIRNNNVRKRPAYDVVINLGTEKQKYREQVLQSRILEEWKIRLIDTDSSGIFHISDEIKNNIEKEFEDYPDIHEKDVIQFTDGKSCTIKSIETELGCIIFFALEFEEDDFTEYLTFEEFREDIEKIENKET